MTNNIFTEKLSWFRQNEKPEMVLFITDNPNYIKIILAWTTLEVRPSLELTELDSDSEEKIWQWLWNNVNYNKKELIEKSGLPFSESGLQNIMKPLIGNRILYPDGTINSFVQRYLREQVVKLFESKPKRTLKKIA